MKTLFKKLIKRVVKLLFCLLGIIYYPVYVLCWVLHIIARLLLSISYLGLLDRQRAKNIFKSLFRYE